MEYSDPTAMRLIMKEPTTLPSNQKNPVIKNSASNYENSSNVLLLISY